jgi:hypothetical protein
MLSSIQLFVTKLRKDFNAFVASLYALRDAIDKNSEAAHEASHAYAEQKTINPDILAILHVVESIQTDNRSSQNKQERYQCRNLIATWVGVFIVAAYTTFSALEWRELRRQTDTTRASIGAILTIEELSVEDFPGENAKVHFKIFNRGNSAARSIQYGGQGGALPMKGEPPRPDWEQIDRDMKAFVVTPDPI